MVNHFTSAFIAGSASTFLIQQAPLIILETLGFKQLYQINSIINLMAFGLLGGLWGIFLWMMIHKTSGIKHWLKAFLYGSLGPTLIFITLLFPIQEIQQTLGVIVFFIVLNGLWGLGTSLFVHFIKR